MGLTDDQMFRGIATAIGVPIVVLLLRLIKQTVAKRYDAWSQEGGGIPYRLGKWCGKLWALRHR